MEVTKFHLQPTTVQIQKLGEMFLPLVTLHDLFVQERAKFEDAVSAKCFLLKHRAALLTYMSKKQLEEESTRFAALLMAWSKRCSDTVRYRYLTGCSISAGGQVWFPVKGLGTLQVSLPSKLLSLKEYSNIKYFDLEFGADGFSLVTYSYEKKPVQVQSFVREATTSEKVESATVRFQRIMKAIRKANTAISGAFATTDFSRLSGRPVSGGLPSLGHR